MNLAKLLNKLASPEAAAAFRLGGGDDTLAMLIVEEGYGHRPGVLLAMCDDGGPPLDGKLWWRARGFSALTGVMWLTSQQARSFTVYRGQARVVRLEGKQMDALAGIVEPGTRLDLSWNVIGRTWSIGVCHGAGDWEWVTP